MTEYITKEQALEAVARNLFLYGDEWIAAYNIVGAIPPVDVAPVVHGRWTVVKEAPISRNKWEFADIPKTYLQNTCKCSNCGFECGIGIGQRKQANYCPFCGARMDGEENAEL